MHANTTIPEILGAAAAYEVTGEEKWLEIVKAYWEMAVTQRGTYATGGQTCGEIWSPKMHLAYRLGDKNQEHCTVYNMMRLADFLFRHTKDALYMDYWERNLYNGIMAQGYWQGSFTHGRKSQYPEEGLLTYFFPCGQADRRRGAAGHRISSAVTGLWSRQTPHTTMECIMWDQTACMYASILTRNMRERLGIRLLLCGRRSIL